MPLTGIQSVSIYVSDQDKALDFYVNKLGFEKHEDAPLGIAEDASLRWVTVAPPGSQTEIVLVKGYANWSEERVGNFAGIVYSVQDIEGTFKELKARGVEITEEPNKQPWGTQAQFKDQDGNTFVVVGE
jgi:lactoylglutathione lyase